MRIIVIVIWCGILIVELRLRRCGTYNVVDTENGKRTEQKKQQQNRYVKVWLKQVLNALDDFNHLRFDRPKTLRFWSKWSMWGGKCAAAGWWWKNGTCGKPGRLAKVRHSWPAAKCVGIPKWWNPRSMTEKWYTVLIDNATFDPILNRCHVNVDRYQMD